jgi:3-oxoacyl-[acyl-carrier-protein] synthase-3
MHTISGVKIRGLSTRYPKTVARTDDYVHFDQEEAEKFKKNVGIFERRIVDESTCASDLCEAACRDLLDNISWAPEEVDALIMITQTGDYPVPATSIILQHKLGIKKEAICFDVNLGCSSFPYGIYIISSLIKAGGLKKAILLIGDVSSKVCSYTDKSAYPLFGDAGTAIALEASTSETQFSFDLMTDGAGYEAIIIESGGLAAREPITNEGLTVKEFSTGINRSKANLTLKGADIFSFAISKVPTSILNLANAHDSGINQYDFMVLHQANKMINDQIVRKTKMDATRVLTSLEKYGNTSSASIPLTLTAHANLLKEKNVKIICSGFGVGLSWGSLAFELQSDTCFSHKEL